MSSREKVFKSHLSGAIDSFLNDVKRGKIKESGRDEGDADFLNIIDFIDRFKLLPDGLYPVQKFIVKLYYKIPLDEVLSSVEKDHIKITDKFGRKVLHTFTEKQYLEFLYNQGRCNIKELDDKPRGELILVLGRRSGKSSLSAIFAAYEIYKLLKRGHPQSYYGSPSGSEIRVLCVANDKEQASIVYGELQGHIDSIDYFKAAKANNTQTYVRFRTEHDREKYGDTNKGTIVATFKSSVAKGLRGRGCICAILDEIAFFVESGKSGAERVYKAIHPSLAQFSPKDPKNKRVSMGHTHGRMILISSPDAREGFFYQQYQMSIGGNKASDDMLMIQAPTWEVNPTLPDSYYEIEYFKDPRSFMTEHGSEFSDRVRGWIEDYKVIEPCLIPDLKPKLRGLSREPHFAGFDLGLGRISGDGDGSSIALTHIVNGRIQLAYHEIWYAGKKWSESNPHLTDPIVPYAHTLHDRTRLDLSEIADWILALSKLFYISSGVFDQWTGIVLEQELHKRNLHQFTMKNFMGVQSSQVYQTFKMLMYAKQIGLYDYPVPNVVGEDQTVITEVAKHSPLISELLELQATSGGKNIVIVEAPKVVGKHDDQSDALARSIMLAAEHIQSNPGILESSQNKLNTISKPNIPSYNQFYRTRSMMHGPVDRTRRAPKNGRRY